MLEDANITNKLKKEKRRERMIEIRKEIDDLTDEQMNEVKFWGYNMDDEEDEGLGREVLKESTYDKKLRCPYKEFPLFQHSWLGDNTSQVGGILRSGQLTGAKLKMAVIIKDVEVDDESGGDDQEPQEETKGGDTRKPPEEGDGERSQSSSEDEEEQDAYL